MDRWTRDLSLALRKLLRAPGSTAIVVLTLALGLGASTGVFTVFNVLVLDPLPFRDSDSDTLVRLLETVETSGQGATRSFRIGARRSSMRSPLPSPRT